MDYLNSYLRSKLDLSHISFIRREKESNYFCTPVLSKVIGWAGVDGIHFCTTKGFDEIIFVVSYSQMTFRIEPDVSRNQFRIVDCAQSDQPRYKEGFQKPDNQSAVAFGIIGGAPTPVLMSSSQTTASEVSTHMTMSSLHFEPAKKIEWRIVFQEIPNDDLTVSLI